MAKATPPVPPVIVEVRRTSPAGTAGGGDCRPGAVVAACRRTLDEEGSPPARRAWRDARASRGTGRMENGTCRGTARNGTRPASCCRAMRLPLLRGSMRAATSTTRPSHVKGMA